MEEKAQMQGLNDRLVAYVERVRSLEMENSQLQQQVSTVEEHTSSEIITMRDSFGHELQSLRKALDSVSKEKAKLEIDADKFEKEAREERTQRKNKEKGRGIPSDRNSGRTLLYLSLTLKKNLNLLER